MSAWISAPGRPRNRPLPDPLRLYPIHSPAMPMIDPFCIDLLRYMLVLRMDKSMVVTPPALSVEMSYLLSTMIADRLPTSQIKPWRKLLEAWQQANPDLTWKQGKRPLLSPPDAQCPIAMTILPHDFKKCYGLNEVLLCELKLFGRDASHELFLELLLPALEQAGICSDSRWRRRNSLWGHCHLDSVWVARGKHWEPLVEEGRIDFSRRPDSRQWARGLELGVHSLGRDPRHLVWFTPLALPHLSPMQRLRLPRKYAPDLPTLLQTLADRLECLHPGCTAHNPDIQESAGEEQKARAGKEDASPALQPNSPATEHARPSSALATAAQTTMDATHVHAPPRSWPGHIWGKQVFSSLPQCLLADLELASILHIGGLTHFGCGTFQLY